MLRSAAALLCLATASACLAQTTTTALNPTLQQQIETITQEPAVVRAHWGVSVTTLSGAPIATLNDGQFFQPASNTKLFTTATVSALVPLDTRLHTRLLAVGTGLRDGVLQGDLILRGGGDANFSGRPVPYRPLKPGEKEPPRPELRYIDELADRIQQQGIRSIQGDIRGDDSLLAYQPYPPDWSLDDMVWYYGAPITSLMIADNSIDITVTPGKQQPGQPTYDTPSIHLNPDLSYYEFDTHDLKTVPGAPTRIDFDRMPGSRVLHLRGTIAPDAAPSTESISIDDPAEYAALALKRALEQRGITVTGQAVAKHGPLAGLQRDDLVEASIAGKTTSTSPLRPAVTVPDAGGNTPMFGSAECTRLQAAGSVACVVADHVGLPLADDIVVTNKVSQNQHADLLLRMLPLELNQGAATTANGAMLERRFLTEQADIDPRDFYFNDGSGMSGHNIVTPRAITQLLRYASTQPWGAQWKASLPVGGVDGSLRSRFPNEPLKNHVFAKTGTLGEVHALSGYLDCRSGQTVVFSLMVNTHTPLNNDDLKAMDRIVASIAAAE
ncbi:D-alanyl-D-alanine carboxypeptidase/D-alanyl-D-alanine endopeptidase [Terriglobus aquaticus]|uniref:D-alanyl-D-alanine carboxypeptidase/D-alanyl-D-alanine-endopeptidase n=1 Tax=Terriglobus aquaticus TaxID=940139 RepID=A0ABW9KHA7_9BACT|nr:D-alanyl-D-alanine carboxypeptidase/D-alanyl-D-alanine-endopeptidase [Terriglobus aquaticus]